MTLLNRLAAALKDRYTIERELGRGGMATVYLARDLKHGRNVAIKVMDPQLRVTVGADRFLTEIRTAARLNHPHILPVFDSGEVDGLLYYVMPHVEGESLRERMDREGKLPVDDAVRIACQVADALAHAHARGIIHRDIKPENILFANPNHAYVADFGLAKELFGVANERLTRTGVVMGTLRYMSPEQAAGHEVTGAADVFSLACVLYEMLVAIPPGGTTASALVSAAKSRTETRSVRALRPDIPTWLDQALLRALARVEDSRPTADDFRSHLTNRQSNTTIKRWRASVLQVPKTPKFLLPRLAAAIGVIGGVGIAIALIRPIDVGGSRTYNSSQANLTLLEVEAADSSISRELTSRLSVLLSHWKDVHVRIVSSGENRPRREKSLTNPADLGVDRTLHGTVSRIGGENVLTLVARSASDDGEGRATVRLTSNDAAWDSLLLAAVHDAVFRGKRAIDGSRDFGGTKSWFAYHSYLEGHAAIMSGAAMAADSALTVARRLDPDFAEASLWLAQLRSWHGEPPWLWSPILDHALLNYSKLSTTHRSMASGLRHLADGEYDQACSYYKDQLNRDSANIVAWYGIAECTMKDRTIIEAPASPSGYAFQASYNYGVRALLHVNRLFPSLHGVLWTPAYDRLRRQLVTRTNYVREGMLNGRRFQARPAWAGDSLAFVPYDVSADKASRPPIPETLDIAVQHQRMLFYQLAQGWVRAFPKSIEAQEALAFSLEVLGNPNALQTLIAARESTSDPLATLRLTGAEVSLRLKQAFPDDLAEIREARHLATTAHLIDGATDGPYPNIRAGLALLLGRVDSAADMADPSRDPTFFRLVGIDELERLMNRLLVFAAAGVAQDSVYALERAIENMISNVVPQGRQSEVRSAVLTYAAMLAFPTSPLEATLQLVAASEDTYLRMASAFLHQDTATVIAALDSLRIRRAHLRPADLTLDAVYFEAWLLYRLGHFSDAAAWLDPVLDALDFFHPNVFAEPIGVGSLLKCAVLRARIAAQMGDHLEAARWAQAVVLLWESTPDQSLKRLVGEMRRLIEDQHVHSTSLPGET